MTEEIIIDGVDVAGCNAYKEGHCLDKTAILLCDTNKCSNYNDCYYKQLKRLEQQNKELKEKFNFMETANDIKKQDIDSLREANALLNQENENIINEYNKLQAEIIGDIEFKELILTGITPLKVLKNLKQRNRELQAFYDVYESFKTDFDTNRKLLDNYRSALEEIREIAMGIMDDDIDEGSAYYDADQIINKIDEVLQ